MRTYKLAKTVAGWIFGSGLVLLIIVSAVSCRAPRPATGHVGEPKTDLAPYGPYSAPPFRQASYAALHVTVPEVPDAELVGDDQLCATCHEAYVNHHQTNIHGGQSCESCHGPGSQHVRTRGQEPGTILSFKKLTAPERSELCLKCHEQDGCLTSAQWRTSPHAHHGVSCTDCHTAHYNVPPGTPSTKVAQDGERDDQLQLVRLPAPSEDSSADMAAVRASSDNLGAIAPHVCYRCHGNLVRQQNIAHQHEICGAIGFNCTTCHDPHGRIRPETRADLCLKCHDNNSPTMAWHSSTHARYGVACVDCHNPHPDSTIQPVVNIQHTNIRRDERLPMSVNEPDVCYTCHADIYAKNAMPSHHPIKEGKISCADCHDPHGQTEDNLREPTVNMVCYRCHAEKQGPFAYEHPPVTEDCGNCHDPHGTVANNLLHQPTTFLCLRCHTGHRRGPNFHDATYLQDVGTDPALQRAFYSDCTQCHSQIHGTDVPTYHLPNAFMR